MNKRPAGELGLFRKARKHVPRDKAGRFVRVEYSDERKLIRKTTREMRERLGLPVAGILSEDLEGNDQ